MKKFLLFSMIAMGVNSLYAQTYCTPVFPDDCSYGDQIDSFEIPSANFSHLNSGCSSNSYGDFTSQTINLNAGVNYSFSITHGYSGQTVKMWIDLNNDGVFTDAAPELLTTVYSSYVGGVDTSTGLISLPASTTPGNYRLRVATRYFADPEPCNIDGFGEAHDYTVVLAAPPSCLAPTDLAVTGITPYAATLGWTASTTAVNVGYEYYLSTSPAAPTSNTAPTGSVSSPALSAPLSGLTPGEMYYVWVRSVCTTTDRSSWSLAEDFTTLCGVVTPNYAFNFDNGINDCWTEADSGNPSGTPSGTSSDWYSNSFLNSGTDALAINLYTSSFSPTTFDSWMITPAFNLSGGNYRVKFDYGLTEFFDTTSGSLGSDDIVQFVVSQDGGNTWTVLQTWNANTPISNTSTMYSYELTSYSGANTKFAFYATNGTVADPEDVEFFVDNFVVEQSTLSTNETDLKKNTVKVYPNPFTDVLRISDVSNVKSISILDFSGKLVKTFEKAESRLYLSGLNTGTYLVVLNMKDGSKQTVKAIKR